MVNFGGARRVVLSSDPGGLFATQVSYPEVNSTFSTSNLQGSNGGYVFSHWEVNGQRQADPSGIAYSRLTETMDVDKVITARYVQATLDVDSDGLPDWFEGHEFGTLQHSSASDLDSDGFSIAQEQSLGLSSVIKDEITEGGIAIRRSSLIPVNFGGARSLNLSSDPPGLVQSQKSLLETNSSFISPLLGGVNGSYVFTHWEVNGQRQSDPSGIGLSKITETLDSDKTIVAKYLEQNVDSDGDGLHDWYEIHQLGTLAHHGSDDPDGDGLAIDWEIRFGLSPSIPDLMGDGGVSIRRAGSFNLTVIPTDSDGDGLNDGNETALGSNPNLADTDGDGFDDYAEWLAGSSLLNANDFPNQAPVSLQLNNNSIAENLPSGSPVGAFIVTDPNPGSSHSILLVEGNGSTHNSLFLIDSNGTLRTSTPLDFEENASLSIRARATDEHNASIEGNFTISLLNQVEDLDGDGIEDHFDPDDDGDGFSDAAETARGTDPRNAQSMPNSAPLTLDLNSSGIPENRPAGTIAGRATATDPDANATLVFSLLSGNHLFNLDTNGTLRTLASFDFETNATAHPITIRVTDEYNASLEGNFTIRITNEMELLDLNGSSIVENRPAGTAVGRFLATDPDPNATLVFSLVPGPGSEDNHLFRIDGDVLRTRVSFDFEAGAMPSAPSPHAQDQNASQPGSFPDFNSSSHQAGSQTGNSHHDSFSPPDFNATRRHGPALALQSQAIPFRIRVRVSDEHNASLEKAFLIDLLNQVEDFDGDGIEDAFDPDDVIYLMPTLQPPLASIGTNGRVSLSSGFQADPAFPLPSFSFEVSESSDFNRTFRSVPALVQGAELHASLVGLSPGSAYYVRVRAEHRLRLAFSSSGFFQTDAGFRHWWEADPASEAGWRQSAWLGAYRPYPSGWIYHLGLGWAYASPDGHGGLWFWTGSEGWIWSAPHSWPHIYSHRSADWLYFIKEREGKPALYDYSTQSIR